ncbi:MAG: hypothetical protein WBD98_16095 [Acidobacteriaceae bacterium]
MDGETKASEKQVKKRANGETKASERRAWNDGWRSLKREKPHRDGEAFLFFDVQDSKNFSSLTLIFRIAGWEDKSAKIL